MTTDTEQFTVNIFQSKTVLAQVDNLTNVTLANINVCTVRTRPQFHATNLTFHSQPYFNKSLSFVANTLIMEMTRRPTRVIRTLVNMIVGEFGR